MLSSAAFMIDWQGGTFHSQDVFILHLHAAVLWLRSTSPAWLSLADNCRDGVYLEKVLTQVLLIAFKWHLVSLQRLASGPETIMENLCSAVSDRVCMCEIVFNLHKPLRCYAVCVCVCVHCGWRSIAACLSAVSVSPCWQVYLKSCWCESPPNTLTTALKTTEREKKRKHSTHCAHQYCCLFTYSYTLKPYTTLLFYTQPCPPFIFPSCLESALCLQCAYGIWYEKCVICLWRSCRCCEEWSCATAQVSWNCHG